MIIKYTHHAVLGNKRHNYGVPFLTYAGPARVTPKRVFTSGRWSEQRYDPKHNDIWLFDTEVEARAFIDTHNTIAKIETYKATKTAYEKASLVSRGLLIDIRSVNPPHGRG